MKILAKFALAAVVVAFVLQPKVAFACTVCMGDSNSRFAEAANGAIFLMLGLLACVLGLLSAFGIYLYKMSSQPIPPHAEFEEEDGMQSSPGLS
jgi:hypothetical protein